MFTYCLNNPVNMIDVDGTMPTGIADGGSYVKTSEGTSGQSNKALGFVPRKDKRKGSERRQKTGARQRNVGHPEGEEHSRVPKGNRGVRKTEALVGIIATTVVMAVIVVDDVTVVGVSDDAVLVPTSVIWWDYATVLAH